MTLACGFRKPRRLAVAALIALACVGRAPRSAAEPASADSLASARALFAEALRDEDEKRYAVALEKFRRVRDIKATLAVRYRIASCLEGLGRLREALADFRAIAGERATTPAETETVASAATNAESLAHRMPLVVLELSQGAPPDAVVTLDGEPVAGAALHGEPIALDPGDHEVNARAPSTPPYASRFNVAPGARLSLRIPLDASAPAAPPTEAERETAAAAPSRTAGYVLVALGGVFATAAVVTYVLRHNDIGELDRSCPGGACPASRESELNATHTRAKTEGTLALVFAGGALVASSAGMYFLLAPAPAPASPGGSSRAPRIAGGAFAVGGRF